MQAPTNTTTLDAADYQQRQHQMQDHFGSQEPYKKQRIINCSPAKLENLRRADEQASKLTKWLCAIIFALCLVVLALVLLDGPVVSFRSSRANKIVDRLSQSLSSKPTTSPGEQGRLLADSSDDHFTLHTESPLDSLAGEHEHDGEHSNDEDDNHASDQPAPQSRNRQSQLADRSQRQRTRPNQVDARQRPTSKLRDSDAICMSPGCVRAAAQILNNMDNQTKPCDDFYQFACGRWIQSQVIPDEKTSLSVFSQNTADLNIKLRALIERAPREEDPPIVGQMRNMYASCMNLTDIEARGDEPLLEVLRDLGGWPVLGSAQNRPTRASRQSRQLNSMLSTASRRDSPAAARNQQQQQQQRRRQPMANTGTQATRANVARVSRRQASLATGTNADEEELSDGAPQAPGGGLPLSTTTTTSRNTNDDDNNLSVGSTQAPQRRQDWLERLIKFRQRGFSHDMIIDLSVVPDVRNSRRYIIELDQSSLGLPDRSYYFKGLNDTTVAAYYNLMVESAVFLGAERSEARKQMMEALEFETSLAKISIPREQRRNVTRLYNKMFARDLYKLAPNIDWSRYLRSLLREEDPERLDLDRDEVIVKAPSFLRQIDTLLQTSEQQVVANYMIWRIVRHSMSGLGRRWRELAHSYSTVTTGRQVEEPRWEQCLGSIDGTLGTALSAFYVKNHFNERSKTAALEMVEYIREEFLRILDEIDWMDEETREEAKLKARSIATYIGYPDELLQDALIEEFYDGIQMIRTNFYQNVRNLRIWSTNYAFGQLRKPNKRGDWKKHARAAVVNAYYNSLENSIEFPAGILQGAFFDAERPNYMNFGAIGYVIGHEITHGFDDRGRQFDREGNDRNWWKPKTDARFKERAQCIIEQYGNYTISEQGLRVNGMTTQGENIADNGGIKEAFRAYRRWTKDHGRETRLPGLSFSPDQLFWISAANIWCGKFRPEVLKLRINSGVHSPAKFRVVGPLSNSVEFAQSFNCPAGSPMNPRKKCAVW